MLPGPPAGTTETLAIDEAYSAAVKPPFISPDTVIGVQLLEKPESRSRLKLPISEGHAEEGAGTLVSWYSYTLTISQ